MKKNRVAKQRSRELRREMTPAEAIRWQELRGRHFAGYKFRRQQPFGEVFLDFYCAQLQLAVEVDGETHLGKEIHDEQRQRRLEAAGLMVLRFWNNEVYDDHDAVLEAI